MIKRALLGLALALGLVAVLAIPAQAAVVEQPRFTVVSSITTADEAGSAITLNVLKPANGVAEHMRSLGQCLNGHGCAWTDANYGGSFLDIVWSIACCACHNLNAGFANTISSSSMMFGSGYGIQWNKGTCTNQGNSTVQAHFTNQPNWMTFQPAFGWNDNFESFIIGFA